MSLSGATLEELLSDAPTAGQLEASTVKQFRDQHNSKRLIVLDDDPTGTQSVTDLPVLTSWEVDDFLWAFETGAHAVYVLTNSRSLDEEAARAVNVEVSENALSAAKTRGIDLGFVSRSDSTLRGHFPLETDTLSDVLSQNNTHVDGVIVVPSFPDAGRITVNSTHYAMVNGHGYVPVGKTEFARDATFGFAASSLPDWVGEKTHGAIPADTVRTIRLEHLRTDEDRVYNDLMSLADGQIAVADAVAETDLRALAMALLRAEDSGKTFIYRTGPPFVRAMVGQRPSAPLDLSTIYNRANLQGQHGLIVIGSHVSLTTSQLTHLRESVETTTLVEIDVARVLTDDRERYLEELSAAASAGLGENHVVLQTSRKLVKGDTPAASLAIARDVSDFLVRLVNRVVTTITPRFVVAKGGITSSDVASRALAISRATVMGPLLDGIVSLWQPVTGVAPEVPYIVFAGNVGGTSSLTDVVQRLSK